MSSERRPRSPIAAICRRYSAAEDRRDSCRTFRTLSRDESTNNLFKIALQKSLFNFQMLYQPTLTRPLLSSEWSVWPEMPILFIRSRDQGGSPKIWKTPLFPLRFFWYQNRPLSYKIKGDKFIFRCPFTIAVYGNRKLQTPISQLFEEIAQSGLELTIMKSQWVCLGLNRYNFGTRWLIWTMFGAN